MSDWYILREDGSITPATIMEWQEWLEANPGGKIILQSDIEILNSMFMISTVFLGLDHNYDTVGPPIVFETMVFNIRNGGNIDWNEEYCDRYTTLDDAVKGHVSACQAFIDKGGIVTYNNLGPIPQLMMEVDNGGPVLLPATKLLEDKGTA